MGKTSVMETRDMDGARFPRDAQNALDAMGAVWRSDTVGTWHWDLRTGTACWNTRMVEPVSYTHLTLPTIYSV